MKFKYEVSLVKRNRLGQPVGRNVELASDNPKAISGFMERHRRANPRPKR
jgi:hypothetical protein